MSIQIPTRIAVAFARRQGADGECIRRCRRQRSRESSGGIGAAATAICSPGIRPRSPAISTSDVHWYSCFSLNMPAMRIARAVLPPCVASSATQRSSIMSQSRGVRRRCCIAASIVDAGFGPIGPYHVLQLSSGYVNTRTLLKRYVSVRTHSGRMPMRLAGRNTRSARAASDRGQSAASTFRANRTCGKTWRSACRETTSSTASDIAASSSMSLTSTISTIRTANPRR